ncbi:hypothetical protein PHAVU_008G110700 [Phaseolus vulgaris]|uniref:DUF674 family protein n=1 Tax=Phaseolus vulgaris TaxID=3885 RepID=V7B6E3_PHAVU|nr:hypothetical protein PHAVU_008G110700g [Phaseolus vulgaris]XP_007140425.1 hypothetical protein PHAVU_008G110700g [Phaseolus vulgaris]ESW12418.1 hypothetical protein PHAVU_008G110700g [Phaseolus vulgaris]ESW12419.1 hypothetical protein PHAVU_008G110700g [Phaseolus vulgaris]
MAATKAPSNEQVYKVPLKVLVDRSENKVVFAEASKDFVDVLLSFLALPLGTIARLVAKESNIPPVKLGSLSSLYESVSNLEEEHLWTPTCKEMLLHPRSSMESYYQHLKLNIDDTDPTNYFLCENLDCSRKPSGSLLSIFNNQRCSCGKLMNRIVSPENNTLENGFVKETATFIICDDLSVLPNILVTSLNLLQKLGIKDMDAIEEQTVDISKREVVDLLKLSMISKSPLTDFIFEKKPRVDDFNPINESWFERGEESSDEGRRIVVRALVRKSNKKIMFTGAEEDFADFLFSFLTLPLGGVLHMLEGNSSLGCIDKLHKSISELSPDRYLRSQRLKEELANPKCATQFTISGQILPIGEVSLPVYYCNTFFDGVRHTFALSTSTRTPYYDYDKNVRLEILDGKSSIGDFWIGKGFAKGPSTFMVTDDLVVTPMSSISAVSYLNRSQVPLSDLEERVISVGVKEGLAILKASLTSTSALSNALQQFTKINELENLSTISIL